MSRSRSKITATRGSVVAVTEVPKRHFPSNKVWLLNADYLVLGEIDLDRAVGMLLYNHARPFKVHPTFILRSTSMAIPFPEIIIAKKWKFVGHEARGMDDHDRVSAKDILRRDGYVCGYCGGYGNTIDHIFPESRGGQNTWANLITACKQCNNDKDDRTPEEAGMKLLWNPKNRGAQHATIQAEVWKILEENGEYDPTAPVEMVPDSVVV